MDYCSHHEIFVACGKWPFDVTLSTSVGRRVGEREMGRRRKKTLRIVHKTLPKVFACPRCGLISIRITSDQDEASQDYVFRVTCGNPTCPLHAGRELRYQAKRADIDVYNTFVDDYAKAGA